MISIEGNGLGNCIEKGKQCCKFYSEVIALPQSSANLKDISIKKILVVAESIDIEDSSGTKGRVALIKNLHKAGFEVIVYHYTRKDIQLEGIPSASIKENRFSLLFFLSRIERQIRYITGWELNKYIEQLYGFSFTLFNDRNSIIAGLKKIKDFEPDLVLTLSKGGSFRPHHALLKIPKWHSKWMAYIHDPYPFQAYPRPYDYVEPGHQKKRNFFLNVGKKAKYAAYPSELLAEWMESYYRPLRGKAVIIPHQIIAVDHKDYNFPEYFNKDNFNILHAGNLLWGRDPKGLIEGFQLFLHNNPEARANSRLIFLGGKNHYSDLLVKIRSEVAQMYVSEDYMPHPQVINMQIHASVNVILEAKSTISPFLPGKFPHCIQADKPILLLGPYYSESRRLLGDTYKYWTEIDKAEEIANLIANLYMNWKKDAGFNFYRPELKDYLSEPYLSKTIKELR